MDTLMLTTGWLVWAIVAFFALRGLWRLLRPNAALDLSGRWIVVTGCDSGFGFGVVQRLIGRGAHVVAFCFTDEGAAQALAAGARLAPRLDLTDRQAVGAAAAEVRQACGDQLWGLVHNAGTVLPGFVEYQPLSFYERVMAVNFLAPVHLTQKLIPALKSARGRIVLVSSVDGIVSLPGNAPYDASKFAIEAYADALRAELSFWKVSVSVINPSTMRTPLAMTFFEGHRKAWEQMDRDDPDGPWKQAWPADWLDTYIAENTEALQRIAQDPRHAIDDIVHALGASRPDLRYLSGTLSKTLFLALWKMPERWSLAIKKGMIRPAPRLGRD